MKELELTKTKIGEKIGSYKGRYTIFSVYYGNYVSPYIDGEFVHLKEDEYEVLLDSFLSSEEGREYRRPDHEEIVKASTAVINSEIIYLKEKEEKLDLEVREFPKDYLCEKKPEEDSKVKRLFPLIIVAVTLLETVSGIYFILT